MGEAQKVAFREKQHALDWSKKIQGVVCAHLWSAEK